MTRRAPYTKVDKKNFNRPAHVEGQSDVLYRGFQCLNPACTNFIFVKDEEITDAFNLKCDVCGFKHTAG
jgi:predicted  nucleic acid-binding Zn ribbon protein